MTLIVRRRRARLLLTILVFATSLGPLPAFGHGLGTGAWATQRWHKVLPHSEYRVAAESENPDAATVAVVSPGSPFVDNLGSSSLDERTAGIARKVGDAEFSMYLGGEGADQAASVVVGRFGELYVTGYTESPDFPAGRGERSPASSGHPAAFVAKIDPLSRSIDTTVFFPSAVGTGVAVDPTGAVYVTGVALDGDFPTTASAFQRDFRGAGDMFVAKLDPGDAKVVYSTLLGGTGADEPRTIRVSEEGTAFVAGTTSSPDIPLAAPLQSDYSGKGDAYFAAVSPDGDRLQFASYFGGRRRDVINASAYSAGTLTLVGATESTGLPTTRHSAQRRLRGKTDAFVVQVTEADLSVLFATYLGGKKDESGNGVAVDAQGNVFVVGGTTSRNFPVSEDALQRRFSGGSAFGGDAFVTKLSFEDGSIVYSSYLGGSSADGASSVAVKSNGDIVVLGETSSSDFRPTAEQTIGPGGASDCFVSTIDFSGNSRLSSVVLGGRDREGVESLSLDETAAAAYVVGFTYSSDYPVCDGCSPDPDETGVDGFITRVPLRQE